MVDVSSWYLIKIFHPFVYVEIAAGALMAACFGIMLLVTMYQMWFSRAPEKVARRLAADIG
jgi:Zn-dependent protease with chaperone function